MYTDTIRKLIINCWISIQSKLRWEDIYWHWHVINFTIGITHCYYINHPYLIPSALLYRRNYRNPRFSDDKRLMPTYSPGIVIRISKVELWLLTIARTFRPTSAGRSHDLTGRLSGHDRPWLKAGITLCGNRREVRNPVIRGIFTFEDPEGVVLSLDLRRRRRYGR